MEPNRILSVLPFQKDCGLVAGQTQLYSAAYYLGR